MSVSRREIEEEEKELQQQQKQHHGETVPESQCLSMFINWCVFTWYIEMNDDKEIECDEF